VTTTQINFLVSAGLILAAVTSATATATPELAIPAATAAASADEAELSTDRPDFTESTDIVPAGLVQIESGLLLSVYRSAAERIRTLSGPLPLVRIGAGKRWELRFGTDGLVRTTVLSAAGPHPTSGLSDAGIGVKVNLLRAGRLLPAISIIPAVSIPVGAEAYSSSHFDPSMKFALSHALPRGWGVGGNWNIGTTVVQDSRKMERAASISASHHLRGGWNGYCELYRLMPADDSGHWVMNSGVTRALGGNAQFDLAIGRSAKVSDPGWFIGVGLTVRRPLGWQAARNLLKSTVSFNRLSK
jgi:hypothetical protein